MFFRGKILDKKFQEKMKATWWHDYEISISRDREGVQTVLMGLFFNEPFKVDPDTFSQSTGMECWKKGSERKSDVFPGDIIRPYQNEDLVGVVKLMQGVYVLTTNDAGMPSIDLRDIIHKYSHTFLPVIIGNIFDNPELLKDIQLRTDLG